MLTGVLMSVWRALFTDGFISPAPEQEPLGSLTIPSETALSSSRISTAEQGQVPRQSQVVESRDPARQVAGPWGAEESQ